MKTAVELATIMTNCMSLEKILERFKGAEMASAAGNVSYTVEFNPCLTQRDATALEAKLKYLGYKVEMITMGNPGTGPGTKVTIWWGHVIPDIIMKP